MDGIFFKWCLTLKPLEVGITYPANTSSFCSGLFKENPASKEQCEWSSVPVSSFRELANRHTAFIYMYIYIQMATLVLLYCGLTFWKSDIQCTFELKGTNVVFKKLAKKISRLWNVMKWVIVAVINWKQNGCFERITFQRLIISN